jgi:hypothetical protein
LGEGATLNSMVDANSQQKRRDEKHGSGLGFCRLVTRREENNHGDLRKTATDHRFASRGQDAQLLRGEEMRPH